ncbi:MAG: hypothetical protein JWP88_447 [Flaviaesturariibacter sp.]|nr:hypothetical protein [Flaviaesturariibacter sp.]
MKKMLLLCALLGICQLVFPQSTSWKGTSSNNWSTSSNWTNGVPTATVDAVIGDASFTGTNQPTTAKGTFTCKSLTLGTGTKASTLTISKNLAVSGSITIGANGTLSQGKGTISLSGNWSNTGTYSPGTSNGSASTVTFNGTAQTVSSTSVFYQLTVNQGSTLTLAGNISASGTVAINGTLSPGASTKLTLTATPNPTFTVGAAGNLKVTATDYSTNYSAQPSSITAGGTVEYASASAQNIINLTNTNGRYSVLKISGAGVRTLSANVTLSSSSTSYGSVYVNGGTLDLGTYSMNRNAAGGGTFNLAASTTLKIANTFPANYTTNSLALTSTVEYYAGNQAVSGQSYGNLILSSNSSGTITKTMPGAPLTVTGNFSSLQGSSTSLTYTAGANITINGTTTIGTGTVFNGSVLNSATPDTIKLGNNFINNGTYTGNNSLVNINGPGAAISGTGVFAFNNLTITASGVTCSATAVSLTGNLSTSGSGIFTYNNGGTLTMSGASKTISGTDITLNNLSVSGTVTTVGLTLTGDLSVSGSYTCNSGTIAMSGALKTISGAGTIGFNTLSASGSITSNTSFSLSGTLNVTGTFTASASPATTVTFTNTSLINGTVNLNNVTINGTSLQLTSNTVLGVSGAFNIISGTLNVTNTVPNKVIYNGGSNQSVYGTAYHNLTLAGSNTKIAAGNMIINGDLTISSGTFDGSTFTHTIYGNWNNSGTFTAGASTISFDGGDDVSITGATTFSTLKINKTYTTNQVSFLADMTATTAVMTKGFLNTGSNKITITGTRSGSGSIIGTILRSHSFTAGIAYAFESDQNLITFGSISTAINAVTVTVSRGTVTGFPFGASTNRKYTVAIPSGAYGTATLRLHYEDNELNGNTESSLALWRYTSGTSTWAAATGVSAANNAATNYAEIGGLTSITNDWTLAATQNVVTWNGSVSTDWNDPANWTSTQGASALPPTTNEIVQIGTSTFTNQPTISNTVSVKSILLGSAKAVTLTLASGGSLTTQGNISGTWTGAATHSIDAGNQNLTCGGGLTLSDGISGHDINLAIGSGTVTLTGDLNQSGNSSISFSAAGTLAIGGNYNYTSGSFSAGSGTVLYNGTNFQTVASVTYNQLTINKSAGNASSGTNTTTAANITITAGQFIFTNATVVTGNMTIGSGTTARNSTTLMIGGNWFNSGTYIPEGGSVTFNGTGAQSIGTTTFNNLIINKSSGTATLTGNISINFTVNVMAGTLDLSNKTLNRTSVGGTFTVANNASLLIGGNNFPANYITYTMGSTSITNYYGTVAQDAGGISYGFLNFTGTGAKTLAGNTTVQGDISTGSGTTLNASSFSIDLYGNWSNNGTFIPGTGTVLVRGGSVSADKSISGNTVFNKLTVYGYYAVATADITFNGALRVLSNASYKAGSGSAILYGDLSNSGILTSTGTTTFMGTVVQTINLTNAITSNSSGIINFNGTVAPVLNSTSEPTFATVNINNTSSAGITPSVNWNVYTAMNISSGASFNGGGFTHNFYGSFSNAGTVSSDGILNFTDHPVTPVAKTAAFGNTGFTSTGTINFAGTKAITTTGTPSSLSNVIVSNTAGVSAGGGWPMAGTFTISSAGVFNAGSYSHSVAGDMEANGTMNGGTSTFTLTSTAGQVYGNDNANYYNLVIAPTAVIQVASDINVSHDFTNNATANDNAALDASAGHLTFTGSTASTINGAASSSFALGMLSIEKTSGATVTLNKSISFINELTITSGTLDAGAFSLLQDATVGAINSLTIRDGATLKLGGTNSLPTFTSYTIDSLSTVDYDGGNQTISATAPYGNLTISTTSAKTAAASLTVAKNFTLSAGEFNGGGFAHTVKGNFTIASGTTLTSAPIFTLAGTGTQTLNSALALTSLTINNSTGLVTLSAPLSLTASLTFTAGKVSIGANDLTISPAGSISSPTSANYIITSGTGQLKQTVANNVTAKVYPVGTATAYLPATITFTNTSTTDVLGVRVLNAAYVAGSSGTVSSINAVNATWEITEAVATGSNATVTLQWADSLELTGFSRTSVRLAHYVNSAWDYGTVGIAAAGNNPYTLTRSGFTSFSPFSVRMNGGSVLPVTWTSVSAKRSGSENHIFWTTANEVNNRLYEVEASTNGTRFAMIGQTPGATNSSAAHSYTMIDPNPVAAIIYYRIKQIDADGSYTYSIVVKVNASGFDKAVTIAPNPVQDAGMLTITTAGASVLHLSVADAAGQVVKRFSITTQAGTNQFPLHLSGQPAGVYFLRVADAAGALQTLRFVKQ